MTDFNELLGKTLTDIIGLNDVSDTVIFECSDNTKYRMWHSQRCCESVDIESVVGDVSDLIGSPILIAEESKKETELFTWTFYKLATIKGYVDIRWYGTSNGNYSESVDFERIKK